MVAGEFNHMSRAGRPPLGEEKLVRCTVYLTSDQVMAAVVNGSGNVSDGIRRQLEELAQLRDWHHRKIAMPAPAPGPLPRARHQ